MTENSSKVVSVRNFHKICRICVQELDYTEGRENYYPIQNTVIDETPLSDLLEVLILVRVEDDPQLPENICQSCMNATKRVLEMRELSRINGNILRFALEDQASDFAISSTFSNSNDMIVQPLSQSSVELPESGSEEQNSQPGVKPVWQGPPFYCERCPKDPPFDTFAELKKHRFKVHYAARKPEKCRICGVVVQHVYLKDHMTTHNPKFACKLCGRNFSHKGSRLAHSRNHDFLTKNDLGDLHPLLKITPACLPCPICDQKFTAFGYFRAHMEKHLGLEPEVLPVTAKVKNFACHLCPDRRFETKRNLDRHLNSLIHSNQFHCKFCTGRFQNSGTLNEHIVSEHSELLINEGEFLLVTSD